MSGPAPRSLFVSSTAWSLIVLGVLMLLLALLTALLWLMLSAVGTEEVLADKLDLRGAGRAACDRSALAVVAVGGMARVPDGRSAEFHPRRHRFDLLADPDQQCAHDSGAGHCPGLDGPEIGRPRCPG